MEENVLHYVAAYVCRKSKDKNKDVMILCLLELSGDEDNEERGTEKWTNELDRGGLWHRNDLVYSLFYAMEQILHSYLQPSMA